MTYVCLCSEACIRKDWLSLNHLDFNTNTTSPICFHSLFCTFLFSNVGMSYHLKTHSSICFLFVCYLYICVSYQDNVSPIKAKKAKNLFFIYQVLNKC